MENKKGRFAESAYVLGIILCPLGVCLSAKSGFGVSMVVATGLCALFAYFRNNSLVYFWKIRVYLSGIAADRAGLCCAAL